MLWKVVGVKTLISPIRTRDEQVIPRVSLVILSPWRMICAQVENVTAQRNLSVDLALSFAEWVRMTYYPRTYVFH